MESSINHPLEFFEYFLTKDNIERELQSFFREAIDEGGVEKIDHDNKEVLIHGQDERGDYALQKISFADIIKRKLEAQYNITKKLINDASVQYQNSKEEFINYLTRQEETIRYITHTSQPLSIQYPYLLIPLKNINEYISNKYSYQGNILSIKNKSESPEDLVISIFGFMQGNNEARQPIMPEEEYNVMIDHIIAFIKEGKVPVLSKKINKTKISAELIRFLFWVLHKEYYTTATIQANFLDFMKATFKQLEDYSFSTLKQKFATKPNIKNKNFLPEIVISHAQKNL